MVEIGGGISFSANLNRWVSVRISTMASSERTVVQLPQIIVAPLSETPTENQFYAQGRKQSLTWVSSACKLDNKTIVKVSKGDLTYFAAVCAPNATYDRYLVFCDWVNWVFPFDDQYDDGPVRENPELAKKELGNWIESVYGEVEPLTKYVKAHQEIWSRFEKVSDPFLV